MQNAAVDQQAVRQPDIGKPNQCPFAVPPQPQKLNSEWCLVGLRPLTKRTTNRAPINGHRIGSRLSQRIRWQIRYLLRSSLQLISADDIVGKMAWMERQHERGRNFRRASTWPSSSSAGRSETYVV